MDANDALLADNLSSNHLIQGCYVYVLCPKYAKCKMVNAKKKLKKSGKKTKNKKTKKQKNKKTKKQKNKTKKQPPFFSRLALSIDSLKKN